MGKFEQLMTKCANQKTVGSRLVMDVLPKLKTELDNQRKKHSDMMNEKNKDFKFLEKRLELVKETNERLKDQVRKLKVDIAEERDKIK